MIKKLNEFETNQCWVTVYESDIKLFNETIYVIQSVHKNNGHINTRFGNEKQLKNLISQYQKEELFKL